MERKEFELEGENLSHTECRLSLQAMEDALFVVGGKWKLRVIIALVKGHNRFNDLQRTINGISAKVLSGELKDLEQNGFIERVVHVGTPVVVEYQLLPYSETLREVVDSLVKWGASHRKKIIEKG
jgi:DNA-binding HxlR family transcriptional regulator